MLNQTRIQKFWADHPNLTPLKKGDWLLLTQEAKDNILGRFGLTSHVMEGLKGKFVTVQHFDYAPEVENLPDDEELPFDVVPIDFDQYIAWLPIEMVSRMRAAYLAGPKS